MLVAPAPKALNFEAAHTRHLTPLRHRLTVDIPDSITRLGDARPVHRHSALHHCAAREIRGAHTEAMATWGDFLECNQFTWGDLLCNFF